MTPKNYFADLQKYSFTQLDIDLIKKALRVYSNKTYFLSIEQDCRKLIEYIERLEKEKAEES